MRRELPTEFACAGGCGATLQRCGIVTYQGQACPVFQCDKCRKDTLMFGEPIQVALTFLVSAEGVAVDPVEADRPKQ